MPSIRWYPRWCWCQTLLLTHLVANADLQLTKWCAVWSTVVWLSSPHYEFFARDGVRPKLIIQRHPSKSQKHVRPSEPERRTHENVPIGKTNTMQRLMAQQTEWVRVRPACENRRDKPKILRSSGPSAQILIRLCLRTCNPRMCAGGMTPLFSSQPQCLAWNHAQFITGGKIMAFLRLENHKW